MLSLKFKRYKKYLNFNGKEKMIKEFVKNQERHSLTITLLSENMTFECWMWQIISYIQFLTCKFEFPVIWDLDNLFLISKLNVLLSVAKVHVNIWLF